MDWKLFTDVVDKVKKLTTKLKNETDRIDQICKEYKQRLDDEKATPKECKDFDELTINHAKVKKELRNVKEKEDSGKITIAFVGTTNSGKSSVINALLGERRLPVGCMQTTMCSIKVCTTEQTEWSVTVTTGDVERNLSEIKDEKAIRELLSKMSGDKHREDREKLGIQTGSTVQVNWPKHLCKVLPSNVVMIDTPGLGENKECTEVVTKTGEKADIIVAVMDVMSPSVDTVVDVVKYVDCQFAFGVFTKWDKCLKEAKKSEDSVDVEQSRKDCEKGFRDALKVQRDALKVQRDALKDQRDALKDQRDALTDQCEVFFVNAKHIENNEVGFKEFQSKLASSATKLKGESLLNQAKSVNDKSTQISQKLHEIVTTRKKIKQDSIEEKIASNQKERAAFDEMTKNLKGTEKALDKFTKDAKEKLLQEFEEAVLSRKSEKEALQQFLDKVNKNTEDIMASIRKNTRAVVEKWTENLERSFDSNTNEMVSDECPQLGEFKNQQEILKDNYKWYLDPNYYFTNPLICGGAVVLATAATGMIGGVALAGIMTAEVLAPFVVGGTVLGTAGGAAAVGNIDFGDHMKKIIRISRYKLKCFRKSLSLDLEKLHKECTKLISREIKRIHGQFSKELNGIEDWKKAEIERLQKESCSLSVMVRQIDEGRKSLEKTGNQLDTLLAKFRKDIERAEDGLCRPQKEDSNCSTVY